MQSKRAVAAAIVIAVGGVACSDHSDKHDSGKHEVTIPPPPGTPPLPHARAAGSGLHLDEDVPRPAVGVQAVPPATHNGPPIDVTLRSSPAGAQVAVDGTPVGNTPAFWSGVADGREHEFTFDLRGYALARYRFVPVTSGVIHARLEPIPAAEEASDAGTPNAESALPTTGSSFVNPPPAPMAPVAIDAAVAPIVPPVDAAGSAVAPAPAPTQPGPQP